MNTLINKALLLEKNIISILKFIGAVIFSLAILGGIIKLFKYFIPDIGTTNAALIAFAGTILAAVIKNYFDRASQIENDRRKEKQKNYDELISSIGKLLRDPQTSNDDFSTIHLKSWIYGNETVVKLTHELIEINRSTDLTKFNEKLEDLLRTMRYDTGLLPIDYNFKMINVFKTIQKTEVIRGT